jgi:hypothetical protein
MDGVVAHAGGRGGASDAERYGGAGDGGRAVAEGPERCEASRIFRACTGR